MGRTASRVIEGCCGPTPYLGTPSQYLSLSTFPLPRSDHLGVPDGWSSPSPWFPLTPLVTTSLLIIPPRGARRLVPFLPVTRASPQPVTSGCPKVGEALRLNKGMSLPTRRCFPTGHISVKEASLLDETSGRNWTMPQANDVRFLAVRGTIMIGDTPLYYQFTLVQYHMYIDTVPWTIFTTLDEALTKEFDNHFFYTLNCRRKDRWGFLDVAWQPLINNYDVDTPYSEVRLSIFDTYGHTRKVVKPFQYNYDYLRVHVNGAAVYADNAETAFLLPLIVYAHRLLPAAPVFWDNADGTLTLCRASMWLHLDTITWLARTGEPYPDALRTELEPQIQAIRARLHGQRQEPIDEQSNPKQHKPPKKSDQPATKETSTLAISQSSSRSQPPGHDQQRPRLQQAKLTTWNTQPYTFNTFNINHDRNYMRLQESFLDIATPSPASEQPYKGPPSKNLPSEAHCPATVQGLHAQPPPSGTTLSQDQESDDSSDWSSSPERLREAIERADLPALNLLQRSLEAQVAVKETKLTQAKARLYLISERQQKLRRNAQESGRNAEKTKLPPTDLGGGPSTRNLCMATSTAKR